MSSYNKAYQQINMLQQTTEENWSSRHIQASSANSRKLLIETKNQEVEKLVSVNGIRKKKKDKIGTYHKDRSFHHCCCFKADSRK
ncbi:23706_t:CDS:2, partial [Dentiscutata erythropus]